MNRIAMADNVNDNIFDGTSKVVKTVRWNSLSNQVQLVDDISLRNKDNAGLCTQKKIGPLGRKRLRNGGTSKKQSHALSEERLEENDNERSRKDRANSSSLKSRIKSLFNCSRPSWSWTVAKTEISREDVLDDHGLAALHIAAQANQVGKIDTLTRRGADVNVPSSVDGATPLHMASRYNCPEAAEKLLQKGADVTDVLTNGQTPLHVCCRRGHLHVAKVLIYNGKADVNSRDKDRTTPLHQATVNGNITVCTLLVENGANIRAMDINEVSPLMEAAKGGFQECVLYLLSLAPQVGISLDDYLTDADNEGNTATHLAVSNRHIDVARSLIERGAPVNCKKTTTGFTPLHQAAIIGEEALAHMLIDQGAQTEITDNEQMTPLHRAALYNRVETILLLIRQGLYLDTKDEDNFTPLLCAAWKGQVDAGRALLRYGADIKALDKKMKSCLHWAVEMQHLEFTTMLFEHGHGGEEIRDWKDREEQTVLHYAAEVGNVQILNLLIESGANVLANDINEQVPLHSACQSGHLECVVALLQASPIPLNDDDIDDMTPLLLASQNGHHRVVKFLIKMGADIGSRNDDRCSALALAAKNNEVQVVNILINHNANVNAVDNDLNTPLHLCAQAGNVEPATLLLNSGADLQLRNVYRKYPLDVAIENKHERVAKAILSCDSWEVAMENLDETGHTPMRRLIAVMPEAAHQVMDQCVTKSHDDLNHPELKVTYCYRYIDPGPDDISFDKNKQRFFALETMVEFKREKLLAHKLSQTCLSKKWNRFASYFNYADLVLYLTFVVIVSMLLRINLNVANRFDSDKIGCPVLNLTSLEHLVNWLNIIDKYDVFPILESENDTIANIVILHEPVLGIQGFILLFVLFRVIHEIVDILRNRLAYFKRGENYLSWMLCGPMFLFVFPPVVAPCDWHWVWGVVAVFVTWMNFIFVLNRFDFFGLYVTMFFTTLKSLLKAMSVYIFFIVGFALAFFICFQSTHESFRNEWTSVVTTFVMTLGEINKSDLLDTGMSIYPFEEVANILVVIFLFLMPMVLVNLTIGISVGDIEQIMRTSYLKRFSLQVDIILRIEKKFPRFLQRKAWLPKAEYWPNKKQSAFWRQATKLFGRGSQSQFIEKSAEECGKEITVQDVMAEVSRQELTLVKLTVMAHQQGKMLYRIAEKHDIKAELEDQLALTY